mmetsp:Transcript_9725/g.17104  ORF Transcript_9725/g.17104 Transcript_9725/m.17104 type:complete len:1701 (-) Transcript_9725:124-5226(-)
MASPLSSFGYVVNKLDSNLKCADDVSVGCPLLALPIESCWTKEAVTKECPAVANAISSALDSNPESETLDADSTWISLHMMYESKKGDSATPIRREHLKTLPSLVETLLAWSDDELESLKGSRWCSEAKRCKAQILDDFDALVSVLGSTAVSTLGLNKDDYSWARQIIQQYGLHFTSGNGSAQLLVAPGLDLLSPDESTVPGAEAAVLEAISPTNSMLVMYAEKSYSKGDPVPLSVAKLACSNGCRLMGCGKLLSPNPCDSAELPLIMPVDLISLYSEEYIALVVEGAAALFTDGLPPKPKPGGCMSADALNGEMPVKMIEHEGRRALSLCVRFSKSQLVPSTRALLALGFIVTLDSSMQEVVLAEEKEVFNVLGNTCNKRRALGFLQTKLKNLLNEFPDKAQGATGRRELASKVLQGEKKIFAEALMTVQEMMAAADDEAPPEDPPTPSQEKALLDDLTTIDGEPGSDTALGQLLALMRGRLTACKKIASAFKGKPSADAGKALKAELTVLKSSFGRCPLGDPMQAPRAPLLTGKDPASTLYSEATEALQTALLAAAEWEKALLDGAVLKMGMLNFGAALSDLVTVVKTKPSLETVNLAVECAMNVAAQSDDVLAAAGGKPFKWSARAPALKMLYDKLVSDGYTRVGLRFTYPLRLPVSHLASSPASFNGAVAAEAIMQESMALASKLKKTSKWEERHSQELEDLLRFFMLRNMMPLTRMAALLGPEVCSMLLESNALGCYHTHKGLIPAAEASKAVPAKASVYQTRLSLGGDELYVFANVMLWPVQEDLVVAVDFDQVAMGASFAPVPYLADDSRALMLGAPRTPTTSVLDIGCGSGAQGLLALKTYAEKATFIDSNTRAITFATFNAYLNGLEGKATFVKSSGGAAFFKELKSSKFDAILASPACVPNPDSMVKSGENIFSQGGPDGQQLLSEILGKSLELLSPGGILTATAMISNKESLVKRLEDWIGSEASYRAVVLHGDPMSVETYVKKVSTNCAVPPAFAYQRALKAAGIQYMSPAMIMLWVPPGGASPPSGASPIDVYAEHLGLWSDLKYVQSTLKGALDQLQMMSSGTDATPTMYAMDWGEAADEEEEGPSSKTLVSAAAAREMVKKGGNKRHLPCLIAPRVTRPLSWSVLDGLSWADFAMSRVFGFAPPVFMDMLWRKVPVPLGINYPAAANAEPGATRIPPSNFAMAVVELEGCGPAPEIVKEAARYMDCYDTLVFDGEPKTLKKNLFGGWRKPKKDGQEEPNLLTRYDTFIIGVDRVAAGDGNSLTLSREISIFLNYVGEYVDAKNIAMRVVVLTCGANGISFPDGPGDEMHEGATLRGLLRCWRVTRDALPILHIDTDAMGKKGDAAELADQLSRELEAYTPDKGLAKCTPEEFSLSVYKTHREVCYRKGERFFPGWHVSQRNPIHDNANVSFCQGSKDDVAVVTGGTGGLGVVSAWALAEAGVGTIVLTSRSGKVYTGQGLEAMIETMRTMCTVAIEVCDTSSEESVKTMLDKVRSTYGKVNIILHAAGIADMERWEVTFNPKVYGSLYLTKHTAQDKIDAFICYSSMTNFLGTDSFVIYGAANSFLEELCRWRRARGLEGTCLMFPEVMGVGMASMGGTRTSGDSSTIWWSIVKPLIKQAVFGPAPCAPLLGILTIGFMMPRPPLSTVLQEPMKSYVNWELRTRLEELGALDKAMKRSVKRVLEG